MTDVCDALCCAEAWDYLRDTLLLILSQTFVADDEPLALLICPTICHALVHLLQRMDAQACKSYYLGYENSSQVDNSSAIYLDIPLDEDSMRGPANCPGEWERPRIFSRPESQAPAYRNGLTTSGTILVFRIFFVPRSDASFRSDASYIPAKKTKGLS